MIMICSPRPFLTTWRLICWYYSWNLFGMKSHIHTAYTIKMSEWIRSFFSPSFWSLPNSTLIGSIMAHTRLPLCIYKKNSKVRKNMCKRHKLWGENKIIDYLFWLLTQFVGKQKQSPPNNKCQRKLRLLKMIQFYFIAIFTWMKRKQEADHWFVYECLQFMCGKLTCFLFVFFSDWICAGWV